MLPIPARLFLKPVDRAGRELESDRFLAPRRRITPEPHAARGEQRYPYHPLELRHVAMPAELRPGPVFGNQRVRELVGEAAGPGGRFRPQRV